MEYYSPDRFEENEKKKILKECAHTRNKHIEIETRYERLVNRRRTGFEVEELAFVLRKDEENSEQEVLAEELGEAEKSFAVEAEHENKAWTQKDSEIELGAEMKATSKCLEENEEKAEGQAEIGIESGLESEKRAEELDAALPFFEILELQKKLFGSKNENFLGYSAPRLEKVDIFDGGDKAEKEQKTDKASENTEEEISEAEKSIEEEKTEAISCDSENKQEEKTLEANEALDSNTYNDEIIHVEVDETILAEDFEEGLGRVFASPLEKQKPIQKTESASVGSRVMGIVLATAVLVAGVLAVIYMWP